jgi:cyclopropane fatty-acyl-phospholipid synthase-like methyltransferase
MEGGDQMQLLETVRSLLGLHVPVSPAMLRAPAGPSLLSPTALPEDDDPEWPTARISVAEALWGEGFLFPGGHDEALRLATPLGLTAASSLLFVGAGTGGAPRSITTELGVWVTGYECNVHLVEVANERNARSGLGRRAQVELWDPIAPKFPPHYFHHAIAVEPLHGAPMEPVLAAMAAAMKPSGQLVLVEAVADRPLDPSDAAVAHWAELERRPADVPTELGVSKELAGLGFDVRIAEDISRRHVHQALDGWSSAVRSIEGARPTMHHLALIVREAELWLARLRLMREGRLRLVRWHAIGKA